MTGPEGSAYTPERPSYILAPPEKKRSFFRRPVGPGMIIAIVIGVVVVRGWLIEGAIVTGGSMEPTLHSGERLLVLKCRYSDARLPSRGDIVIFPDPQEMGIAVKRVIGLPEEKIVIRG
ncbi:MAG: signal peptidase I, partial [Armatimonadetes bacterium]|nr:signal peptidase I [Armatimonadota bacterium]NIM23779.1 signal peptidase I [Armatimonadota bacterium]NIM67656.1 signal peptidase I [Armatimonadota bacterium]NIM76172.1 signal peptidase I [Armatimonadota bacterium]NIN05857.1 signal peptidase I [Armatimonadota bacterium]